MSYILDALRKADAERDRGNVPGIHAQPSFGGAMPPHTPPAAKPWLWVAAGALAVLLIGALAGSLIGPPHGSAGAAAPPLTAPIAAAPPPVAVAVAPVQSITPKPDAAPAIVRKTRPTPPASSAATAVEPKAAASGEKVYTIAELPEDIRRQLPNVTVGGARYSSRPADRILIINGQVLHEGDNVAPDLKLQQIRQKAALMNFKGYRYTIDF